MRKQKLTPKKLRQIRKEVFKASMREMAAMVHKETKKCSLSAWQKWEYGLRPIPFYLPRILEDIERRGNNGYRKN